VAAHRGGGAPADIPFRLVVADSIYGENADLEAKLFTAQIPYIMGLKPSHGTWQQVDDPANPPAFTPAEAAARFPLDAWQRTVRFDSHGKELVRYVAELELGPTYGPTKGIRLIAATLDPQRLKPESTWYLATSLPLAQVSAEQVYELYRLRDWIEHYYKPVKHELGWTDYQMRPERAIVRHWQLVMLAYTFSLLVGAAPASAVVSRRGRRMGEKSGADQRRRVPRGRGAEREAGRLERGAASGTSMALPVGAAAALLEALVERPSRRPELAALLAHLARSLPLDAPT